MSRTYMTGFETGALSAEITQGLGSIVGSVAIDTSIVRSGTYSLKLSPASGAEGYFDGTGTGSGPTCHRFYLRVTTRPAALTRAIFAEPNNPTGTGLRLTAAGNIELRNANATVGTSSTALTDTSRWYRIEFFSSPTDLRLYIDGTQEVALGSTPVVVTV